MKHKTRTKYAVRMDDGTYVVDHVGGLIMVKDVAQATTHLTRRSWESLLDREARFEPIRYRYTIVRVIMTVTDVGP